METQEAFCGGSCLILRGSHHDAKPVGARSEYVIMKMAILQPESGIFCSLTWKARKGDEKGKTPDDGSPSSPPFSVTFRTETLNPLAAIAIG